MTIWKYPRWVYVLPTLHLCSCLMLPLAYPTKHDALAIVWAFVMLADIPVSFPAYVLAWKYELSAATWIFVVGTWWWYFLSQFLFKAIRRFNQRNEPPISIR